jgi:hypothetical protein
MTSSREITRIVSVRVPSHGPCPSWHRDENETGDVKLIILLIRIISGTYFYVFYSNPKDGIIFLC